MLTCSRRWGHASPPRDAPAFHRAAHGHVPARGQPRQHLQQLTPPRCPRLSSHLPAARLLPGARTRPALPRRARAQLPYADSSSSFQREMNLSPSP